MGRIIIHADDEYIIKVWDKITPLEKSTTYAMRVDGYNCQGNGKWHTGGMGNKHINYQDIVNGTYQLLLGLVTSEDGNYDIYNAIYDKFTKIVDECTTELS